MTENVEQVLEALERFRVDDRVYELVEGCRVGLRASLSGDAIYLMKILSDGRTRGEGNASETLEQLCEHADRHDVVLFLEVETFEPGGLDEAALLAWYARFGFCGDREEMIREPRP